MKKKTRSNPKDDPVHLQPPKQQHSQEAENIKPSKQQKFSLYLLLQVQRTATAQQIKKQYRKLAFKYHPDKNKDPDAKQKFHKFKEAYDILADPDRRKIYDKSGLVGKEEEFDEKGFQSAYEYFRNMFKKVTKEDIQDFEKEYRYGAMQQQDLLKYYQDHEGNMVQLIESIPLSRNEDVERYIRFFEQQIEGKRIEKYKSFDRTKNKVRLLKDERKEFEEEQREREGGLRELALAIRGRREERGRDFLAELEEKYGGGRRKKAGEGGEREVGGRKRGRGGKGL